MYHLFVLNCLVNQIFLCPIQDLQHKLKLIETWDAEICITINLQAFNKIYNEDKSNRLAIEILKIW
jgi:hypothetical protein